MSIGSREIIRLIKLGGWLHFETNGSHWQFVHPSRPGRVTVPHPEHDLPIKTVRSIEKQSGVILRSFR
jgi:predicted RNA binding protein YcfA (HicA-like mRNA interferase family)